MAESITVTGIQQLCNAGEKIVCLTAYDFPSAQIADLAKVDVVLVGDSLGNVIQGHDTTIPVELDDICYHVRAVRRGLHRALLVADLPFGSYNVSTEQAVESSIKLMKAGASAVKLEGDYLEATQAITKAGIPVMGHVGFTPQSIHNFGGAKVQGRGDRASMIIEQARSIEAAGAFAIVLELIPADLAKSIAEVLNIPAIGIGAGISCDGEIQVWHDVLGISEKQHKHTRFFMDGRKAMIQAVTEYSSQVRKSEFPGPENSF